MDHDKDGWTTLVAAAEKNPNPDMTAGSWGADIKAQEESGWTALLLAATCALKRLEELSR
jgi:hypothetical protein